MLGLAVAGLIGAAMASQVAPHLPWHSAAVWAFASVYAAVVLALPIVVRLLFPVPESPLEVVPYAIAETYEAAPHPLGMERHFHPDRPGTPGVPGMLRGGLLLVVGLVSSDLARAASGLDQVRARRRNRGRGPTRPAPLRGPDTLGARGPRHDDRRAA